MSARCQSEFRAWSLRESPAVTSPGDTYIHGHSDSVLRSHRWRTADNSAAYLLPHLADGQRLLDVGCGPGTLTVDLAGRVGPTGAVVGVDLSAAVVAGGGGPRHRRGGRATSRSAPATSGPST